MQGDFSRLTFDPQKHFRSVRMQQGRVLLDADWNEQADLLNYALAMQMRDLIGPSGALAAIAGFELTLAEDSENVGDSQPNHASDNTLPIPDFQLSAGRYYVDGILCENYHSVLLNNQPHPTTFRLPVSKSGYYLAYLDVWERYVTGLDDSSIREVALGGLETTGRTQTIWQVKFLPIQHEIKNDATNLKYEHVVTWSDWQNLIEQHEHKGMMRARRRITSTEIDNRLYRVEIHHAHDNQASFKWSRENGSTVYEVDTISEANDKAVLTVTLCDLGRDKTVLHKGTWVELVTPESALGGHTTQLYQITAVPDFTRKQLTLTGDPNHHGLTKEQLARKPLFVRVWDQKESSAIALEAGAVPLQKETWLDLEAGIQVSFPTGGHYHVGDYWLIPARTLTGDIEWARNTTGPIARPPDGVKHYLCPLALVQRQDDQWKVTKDLRRLYAPLPTLTNEESKHPTHPRQDYPRNLFEVCESDQDLETGDLVSLVGTPGDMRVARTNLERATLVVGIVAAKFEKQHHVIIYGRAKCKVIGAIKPGDRLTASEREGCARRADVETGNFKSGTIVGKALVPYEPGDTGETGVIDILVTLG